VIKISQPLSLALSGGLNELIYLVKIGDTDPILTTSHYTDFDLLIGGDTETYISDGRLVAADKFTMSEVLDSSSYSIVLADPNFTDVSHVNEVNNRFLTKNIVIKAAVLNTTNSTVIDSGGRNIAPGKPFQDIRDTLTYYAGVVNEISLTVNTSVTGSVLLNLKCSSPMANLGYNRSFKLNRDFIRDRNLRDSCCDYVGEGFGSVRLLWGKK
jgi:hypothetical protein